MRLIDADALGMHFADWVFGEYLTQVDVVDVFKMMDNTPTVEAIPIEWLLEWAKKYLEPVEEYTEIVEDIIKGYRKEQKNENTGKLDG